MLFSQARSNSTTLSNSNVLFKTSFLTLDNSPFAQPPSLSNKTHKCFVKRWDGSGDVWGYVFIVLWPARLDKAPRNLERRQRPAFTETRVLAPNGCILLGIYCMFRRVGGLCLFGGHGVCLNPPKSAEICRHPPKSAQFRRNPRKSA